MSKQMEMWEGQKIPQEVILIKAKEQLAKIYRNTQGLFKRLNELQAEAEFISGTIEDIEQNGFYEHAIDN